MTSELDEARHDLDEFRKKHNVDLEEQYSQAANYEKLLQDKSLELESLKRKVTEVTESFDKASDALNASRRRIKDLEIARDDLQRALDEQSVNDQILELQVKVAQQFEAHTAEREKLQGEVDAKQHTVDRLVKEAKELTKKCSNMDKLVEELKQQKLVSAKVEKLESRVKELTQSLDAGKETKAKLEQQVRAAETKYQELASSMRELQQKQSDLKKSLSDRELALESLKLEKQEGLKHVDAAKAALDRSKLDVEKVQKELQQKSKRIAVLESQETDAKNEIERLSSRVSLLEQKIAKNARDKEDLVHDMERQQKELLALERKSESLRQQADGERQKRSEGDVSRRKAESTLERVQSELQEKSSKLEALQKVIKGSSAENGVDLAMRLREEEKSRKKLEEQNSLLEAQLSDALKRLSDGWQDENAKVIAKRRSLLFDGLATVSPQQAARPKRVPNFDKLERNAAIKSAPDYISKKAKQYLEREPELDDKENVQGKSKEELEELLLSLRKSKNELLGVYHETAKSLVNTKDQLAAAMLTNKQLDRENRALMDGSGDHGSELKILLEAESAKNRDLLSSVHLYRNRAEEYYSKLESAESVVIKATRAEQFAKSQIKEAEEAVIKARAERAQAEKANAELQSKIGVLEEDLENSKIDLAHALNIQNAQARDIEAFNQRWESEMGSSKSTLDAMRNRYSEEIRKLSTELEVHKQKVAELSNNQSGNTADLKHEVKELRQIIEDSQLAYQDSQKRIGSLLSQVRTLRSTMEDITKDRDQLQKDKRTLESRLTEASKEIESFAASERLDRQVSMRQSMRQPIRPLGNDSQVEKQLQQSKYELDQERKKINLLEKERERLHLKVLELETTTSKSSQSQFLLKRVEDLENQLKESGNKYAEELRQLRSDDRAVKDLEAKLIRSQNALERLQDESDKNASKVKWLQESLEQAQAEETTHRLAARRAEREARDLKERSLRLEKELESWKERFDRKSYA